MTPANREEGLNQLWADPANWTRSGLYRCESDPRLWVLKRGNGIGYTINVAHRRSWLMLVGVLVIAVAPTLVSLAMGPGAPAWLLMVELLVPVSVVVILLLWLSARKRN